MFNHAKIALAAALVLGAASAARANDSGENHQDEDRVVSSTSAGAGGAYGSAAAPMHKQRPARTQSDNR